MKSKLEPRGSRALRKSIIALLLALFGGSQGDPQTEGL